MKKVTTLLLGLGTLACVAGITQARNELSTAAQEDAVAQQSPTESQIFSLADSPVMKLSVGELKADLPPFRIKGKNVTKKAISSVADVTGYYVGTYSTLATSSFDGGSTMQIVADTIENGVVIKSFWAGYDVHATVNVTNSTITIPSQYIMSDATYGPVHFAPTGKEGKPDYNGSITGTISSTGEIDFSQAWWGFFLKEPPKDQSKYKDLFLAAYTGLKLQIPNGQFTYTNARGGQMGYYVVINQESKNILKVTNIFNAGLEVEIQLNRDRTAEINNQTAMINANGSWTMIACKEFNSEGALTSYSPIIKTSAAATDNNTTLSWTDWSLLCAEAKMYAGKFTDAKLKANKPFEYPSLSVNDFAGSGTEADPYLISSLDHLILLADKVNSDKNYTGKYGNTLVTSVYAGKYFAIDKDIDMQNYRFEPIGYDIVQRFAGHLDGRGHKISGLNVNVAANSMYAGLFGLCDTTSVIKNIVLESPSVTARYATGSLVGWTFGSIENITVTDPTINGDGAGNGGVVGIATGSVKNCNVTGGQITGSLFVGGVAGEVHGGMSDCSADGTTVLAIGDGAPVGGVVGNLLDADGKNLSFSGTVSYGHLAYDVTQIMGGVAGLVQGVTLSGAVSAGRVVGYSSTSLVGGVVGRLSGVLEDSYSSGVVHCYSRMTGGIVGQMQPNSKGTDIVVRNCYTSATVEAETYQYDRSNCMEVIGKIIDGTPTKLENIYFDKQVTNFYSTRFGALTSELTSAQGPAGFSADKWTFTEGAYPRIKALAESEISKYSASAVDMKPTDSFKKFSSDSKITALGNTMFKFLVDGKLSDKGHYATIEDGMIKIGESFGTDTLFVVNGNVSAYHYLSIAPIPFIGDGTEVSPYLIKTKEDMIALSEATTKKGQMFPEMYFEVANDIDMEHDTRFDGINADNSIQASSIGFSGIFDGKGHTIDNITLNRAVFTTPIQGNTPGTVDTKKSRAMSGLFGRVMAGGIIRNVNIGAGCVFDTYSQSGALVGQLNGLVENCRNYADVTAYSCWVGGIVGQVNKGGIIRDCYNAGNITTGYANAGGIAGSCNGTIENCVNTGDIKAILIVTNYKTQLQRVGGISGGSGGASYKNCVNFGTVYAERNNAGGVVAALEKSSATAGSGQNDMVNCLNFGNVYCGNKATLGAMTGLIGSPNISNNYYDVQAIGLKGGANSEVKGITPSLTSTLISGTPLDGFNTEDWDFTKGLYPVQKKFAEEPKVAAARKVIIEIPDEITVADLTKEAVLGDGATWSLASGKEFKIEGNKLMPPAEVKTVVTDTLYAVNAANVKRPILVTVLPDVPLTGEGTAEAPYLVNNADEWNTLCAYVDATGDNMKDKFVKVTADLDLTPATTKRLGADGVTGYAGSLNFDNHTVKVSRASVNASDCALIGTVLAEGSVSNLVLEGKATGSKNFVAPLVDKLYGKLSNVVSNVAVNSTSQGAAGVVGNAYDGAAFDNVSFKGTITSSSTGIGGIVATTTANGQVTFNKCSFEGKISASNNPSRATALTIGGIVANCGSAIFTDCFSKGEITLTNTKFTTTVSGMVAMATGSKDFPLYKFTNCYNSTPISAGGKIAGILSAVSNSAANVRIEMTDCYNTADISSLSTTSLSSSPTAGLVIGYTPGSKIVRCHNEGTILSNKNVYAAGIAGYYYGTANATNPVEITDCYNSGLIVADGNQGGGICGYVNGAVTLTGCYNTADIEGNAMVGGITSGMAGTDPKMINCYNLGNVTSKQYRAGGLIAWGAPTNGTIEGCWNAGTIASTNTVQNITTNSSCSIGGLAGQSGAAFINCANYGEVKGLARVGGLVGEPSRGKTKFENCYNAGVITAPADSCGSIVGVNIENGKIWNADNAIVNTYFINTNKADFDKATEAKGVDAATLATTDLGAGFDSYDNATFPVIKAFADNATAVFYAAQLIPAEGNTLDNITGAFSVGGSPLVSWSSDCDALAFSGIKAEFTKSFIGKVTVTAKAGELTKSYELNVNATSGIDGIDAEGDIVEEHFFTTDGLEVARPESGDGNVYIRIVKYSDGKTVTEKVKF